MTVFSEFFVGHLFTGVEWEVGPISEVLLLFPPISKIFASLKERTVQKITLNVI